MKIFKYVFVAIGLIIATLLITALFLPKEYTVSRDITIDRSKAEVFDYARMLKHQHD